MQKNIVLNNGVEMPIIGYGVFKVNPEETERCVSDALSVGYRMIDTAQFYANEEAVGRAMAKSSVARRDIFLITKVWITRSGEERALASIDESLTKLGTDYVDLVLVHQPYGDYYGTYRALEKALDGGKTRAIGLSNFYKDRYVDLVHHSRIVPAITQLETNVFSQQTLMRKLFSETGTKIMAWGPMAQGKEDFLNNEILKSLAEKYNKSITQIGLRFLVQQGIPVIPKSTNIERMKENIEIFDFSISDEDMGKLKELNKTDTGTRDYTSPEYASRIISQTF